MNPVIKGFTRKFGLEDQLTVEAVTLSESINKEIAIIQEREKEKEENERNRSKVEKSRTEI